jgi:hypothetical protein
MSYMLGMELMEMIQQFSLLYIYTLNFNAHTYFFQLMICIFAHMAVILYFLICLLYITLKTAAIIKKIYLQAFKYDCNSILYNDALVFYQNNTTVEYAQCTTTSYTASFEFTRQL